MDKSKALQKATLGGSLVAAITASLCCIGPLIAVALGAGGFAAFAVFEKWRPVFLGFTFALLALAWYLTYRRPKTSCEDDSVCATKPGSKRSRIVLWFATGCILIAAAFPTLSSTMLRATQADGASSVAGANTAVLKAKIPGMDCAACAVGIQAVLRNQAGVRSARVSYDTKEAVVQYDATKLSPEKIIAVIDQTGFKAEPVSEMKLKERGP
ncbi:heavy-metal-associated domain-containing protein [bacterium]|nr:heavy-metal-associated domain-containing protein [bacterium]